MNQNVVNDVAGGLFSLRPQVPERIAGSNFEKFQQDIGLRPLKYRLSAQYADSSLASRDVSEAINDASIFANIDPEILLRMAYRESGFNPARKSLKGASGLFGVRQKTFGEGNVFDIKENARRAANYLSDQEKRFKNPLSGLAAYNAGPTAVNAYLTGQSYNIDGRTINPAMIRTPLGIPPYKETLDYLDWVFGPYRRGGALK